MTGAGKSILVVDDDPVIRDILGAMLQSQDFSVSFCSTGQECLELIGDVNNFSFIFLDMFLSDMSGVELIEQSNLSSDYVRDRVVIVSGNSLEEVKEIDTGGSINHYLAKPFTMASLGQLLEGLETN